MVNDKIQITNKSADNKRYDIRERALDFAAKAGRFVIALPRNNVAMEYGRQLIRSSASVGANLEEADGTLPNEDFINKVSIGRREARESRYWLNLIQRVELLEDNDLKDEAEWFKNEAREPMLILSSVINKTQNRVRAVSIK